MSSSDATATATGSKEKTEWPELVGQSIKEAKKVILKDKPDAKIAVLSVNARRTEEFVINRVRVFVGTVAQIPRVG